MIYYYRGASPALSRGPNSVRFQSTAKNPPLDEIRRSFLWSPLKKVGRPDTLQICLSRPGNQAKFGHKKNDGRRLRHRLSVQYEEVVYKFLLIT